MNPKLCRWSLPLLAALVLAAAPGSALAAALDVTVGTVTAAPGATVDVPIAVTPGPAGLGILGIQLRLDLNASIVQSSSFVAGDGWVYGWGAPATNANASFAAAAAAGVTPLASGGATVATVRVVVRADAPLGTNLTLPLSTMLFNEGTPSVHVGTGLLRVRAAGADAPTPGASGLALSAPWPNPARGSLRLAYALGRASERVRLSVISVDGRLVRTLAEGADGAGAHERTWDLRDAAGRAVPAGLYFLRLEADGEARLRRVAVTP